MQNSQNAQAQYDYQNAQNYNNLGIATTAPRPESRLETILARIRSATNQAADLHDMADRIFGAGAPSAGAKVEAVPNGLIGSVEQAANDLYECLAHLRDRMAALG